MRRATLATLYTALRRREVKFLLGAWKMPGEGPVRRCSWRKERTSGGNQADKVGTETYTRATNRVILITHSATEQAAGHGCRESSTGRALPRCSEHCRSPHPRACSTSICSSRGPHAFMIFPSEAPFLIAPSRSLACGGRECTQALSWCRTLPSAQQTSSQESTTRYKSFPTRSQSSYISDHGIDLRNDLLQGSPSVDIGGSLHLLLYGVVSSDSDR